MFKIILSQAQVKTVIWAESHIERYAEQLNKFISSSAKMSEMVKKEVFHFSVTKLPVMMVNCVLLSSAEIAFYSQILQGK